jgi:hypothetical protein
MRNRTYLSFGLKEMDVYLESLNEFSALYKCATMVIFFIEKVNLQEFKKPMLFDEFFMHLIRSGLQKYT